ncbi:MAG: hypothetical protein LBP26_02835 [Clostridiales bacterium]|jgi:hypothetical protein|nr:hypothetical protein [Clostridiales bacterium]
MEARVKKGGFITTVCFAGVCLLFGVVVLLAPNGALFKSNYPVEMSEKVKVVARADGGNGLSGKIKNVSSEPIRLFSIALTVKSKNQTVKQRINLYKKEVDLAPGAEYDLSTAELDFSPLASDKITEVVVSLSNYEYAVYDAATWSPQTIVSIVMFSLAAVFGLSAWVALVFAKKRANRVQSINDYAASLPGDAIYINGVYSEKGLMGKAIAKSIFSALGAMFSAVIFGAGFYKIHSGAVAYEVIITDGGLLLIRRGVKRFKEDDAVLIPAGDFPAPSVTVNKRQVILQVGDDKGGYFAFNLKGSGVDADTLTAALNRIFIERASSDPYTENPGQARAATAETAQE